MKPHVLTLVLVVMTMVGASEACHAKLLGTVASSAIRGSTRSVALAARQAANQAVNQAVNQVATQVGGEVAKRTALQAVKDAGAWLGKKAVEVSGQAVVFGAVDAAGDALRESAKPADDVTSQVVAIQKTAKQLHILKSAHEEKKMEHEKEMKRLELKEKQLVLASKPSVITEEIDAEDKDASTNKLIANDKEDAGKSSSARGSPPMQTKTSEWIYAAANIGGFFSVFMLLFLVYSCWISRGSSKGRQR